MDVAIITGVDADPGLKIARKLVTLGYRVYGLGQAPRGMAFAHPDFFPVECDITDASKLQSAYEQIEAREEQLGMVVHAAWHAPANKLEAASAEEVLYGLQTNLAAALLLARLTLPRLIRYRGTFVLLDRGGSDHGMPQALAGTWKAALKGLADGLRMETRDTGVSVVRVEAPDSPAANEKDLSIKEPQSRIDPQWVADALEALLQMAEHNTVADLVVRPVGTRETPAIAKTVPQMPRTGREVVLPPIEKFPRESEMIETPPRRRPDDAPPPGDDDDDIEEDDELDRLIEQSRSFLKREVSRNRPQPRQNPSDDTRRAKAADPHPRAEEQGGGRDREHPEKQRREAPQQQQADDRPGDESGEGRRRKRRRGRNRNRNRGDREHRREPDDQDPSRQKPAPDNTPLASSASHSKQSAPGPNTPPSGAAKPEAAPVPRKKAAGEPAAKKAAKRVAKKAAKKAVKKAARKIAKKTAARKTVEKPAG